MKLEINIESSNNEEFDENNGEKSNDEKDKNISHNMQKLRCRRLYSSSEEENTQYMEIFFYS